MLLKIQSIHTVRSNPRDEMKRGLEPRHVDSGHGRNVRKVYAWGQGAFEVTEEEEERVCVRETWRWESKQEIVLATAEWLSPGAPGRDGAFVPTSPAVR